MRELTKPEIDRILQKHRAWLRDDPGLITSGPNRANFLRARVLPDVSSFRGADLRYVFCRESCFQGVDFRDANLQFAYFTNADLFGSNFLGADLKNASFRGSDLRETDLTGAVLDGANLVYADIRGARIDVNIRDCTSFAHSKFTPDALPWLILHPRWAGIKDTVQIIGD